MKRKIQKNQSSQLTFSPYIMPKPIKRRRKSFCIQSFEGDHYANVQFNLGVCLANGIGIEKNEFIALQYYRSAAEKGYAEAQVAAENLLEMYPYLKKSNYYSPCFFTLDSDSDEDDQIFLKIFRASSVVFLDKIFKDISNNFFLFCGLLSHI